MSQRLPLSFFDGLTVAELPEGDDANCMICLTPVQGREEALKLPCSHLFHRECASAWLHHNPSCPNCRRDLKEEEPQATAG
mmetsp:Transcript_46944/g.110520  ORF Transcript_46944/g.110520 Transcript_46944/m.110520 type:complete len:81 (-) Transcript_46944:227-469(-)